MQRMRRGIRGYLGAKEGCGGGVGIGSEASSSGTSGSRAGRARVGRARWPTGRGERGGIGSSDAKDGERRDDEQATSGAAR
jgi:hypothetical protein